MKKVLAFFVTELNLHKPVAVPHGTVCDWCCEYWPCSAERKKRERKARRR